MTRKEWKECDLPGDAFLTVENLLQYLLDGPAFFKSLPECEDAWENGIPPKLCFLYRYFFYFNGIERKYLAEDRIRFHSERLKHVPHTSLVSCPVVPNRPQKGIRLGALGATVKKR